MSPPIHDLISACLPIAIVSYALGRSWYYFRQQGNLLGLPLLIFCGLLLAFMDLMCFIYLGFWTAILVAVELGLVYFGARYQVCPGG